MKKIMSLFSSFVFMVSCCAGPVGNVPMPQAPSGPTMSKDKKSHHVEAVRRIKHLTVKLSDMDPGGPGGLCSAIWIRQGMLLTANHCVKEAMMMSYVAFDDPEDVMRLAIPLAKDVDNDIAVLYVDPTSEPPHDVAQLSDDVIESGEDVDGVGHTLGLDWTYSKGYVAAVRSNMSGPGTTEAEKVIQISSPAWMGNSGGGAFDDDGRLVGICSWVSTSGPFLTFFIHRDTIRQFLKREIAI